MTCLTGFASEVMGNGCVFFPGEVCLFIFSVAITLLLIWYVEKF